MKTLLLFLILLYSFPAICKTCDCLEKTHKEDYQQASFVIRGMVDNAEESTKNKPMYNLTIESIYKNNTETPIDKDMKVQIHLNHHESCRPELSAKKSYIFYISKLEKNIFYLHSCHRMYEVTNDYINSRRYIELLEFSSIKETISVPKQKTPQIDKYNKKLPNGKFGKLLEKHHPND
jgi:hypothetical protein